VQLQQPSPPADFSVVRSTKDRAFKIRCVDERQAKQLSRLQKQTVWTDCSKLLAWFKDSVASPYVAGFYDKVRFCSYDPQESIGYFRENGDPESATSELVLYLNVKSICWNLENPWYLTTTLSQILTLVYQELFAHESRERQTRRFSLKYDIGQLLSLLHSQ
jgi:hypothetical protein